MCRRKIILPLTLCAVVTFAFQLPLVARYAEDFDRNGNVNAQDVVALLSSAIDDRLDPQLDYDSDGGFSLADALAMLINIARGSLHELPQEPGDITHRELAEGEVAVSGPGSYSEPGVTYVLTQNVSSSRSAIFLGNDVVLDLNGYTLSYADTTYEHVPNYGFEDGLESWDLNSAPGAKVEETARQQTFIGEKLLFLPAGEEIVSQYVNLPVADRTYYAICGVTSLDMTVTVSVDDADGNPVYCESKFSSNLRITCPETARSPKLGGGFVFAQLRELPAGNYRIRVKAEGVNCLIDHVDIRPSMDVGVGIVGSTAPWSYYKSILDGDYAAFTDYTVPGTYSTPVSSVPKVEGSGTVTIKNGVIRSGTRGVRSWGVQSTAGEVMVRLENVRFEAEGINTNAVDVRRAEIDNCSFIIDSPFIIDRHRTGDQPVYLRGPGSSTVSNCRFEGGQGCLTLRGDNSEVTDNLFVNHQMVTNHYSINVTGEGTRIFNNSILPLTGSGILVGGSNGIEIFDNLFRIESSPPTCEYGNEEYSVNAIRITDYNRQPGSEGAAANNLIHDNEIHITARDYPQRGSYRPMAYGVFLSVGGGTNYFYANTVEVEHQEPASKALAAAFYIGGSDNGGEWFNNTVTSNVPAVWVASMYGSAASAIFRGNTFISSAAPADSIAPVRMGYSSYTARDISFMSNTCQNMEFSVGRTVGDHSYKVHWTIELLLLDSNSTPVAGSEVVVMDISGTEVSRSTSDNNGMLSIELLAYEFKDGSTFLKTPFTVIAGGTTTQVSLTENTALTLQLP
jgi:hypothetical protein